MKPKNTKILLLLLTAIILVTVGVILSSVLGITGGENDSTEPDTEYYDISYTANDYYKSSYYETMKTLDEVNSNISQLSQRVNSGDETDERAIALMGAYPRTEYDDENNTISVLIEASSDAEFDEYVRSFKLFVGDWESVIYKASSGYIPMQDDENQNTVSETETKI